VPTFTKKITTAAGHRVVERTTDDPAEANSLRYSGWQQAADAPDPAAGGDPAEPEPEPGALESGPGPAAESEPEPGVDPGPGTELSLIPAPSEDHDGPAAD